MNIEPTFDRLRLVGAPGLTKVMAGELSRLVRRAFSDKRLARPVKEGTGAVAFPFDPEIAAMAARFHRTASRVVWDLYQSRSNRLEGLYDDVRQQVERDTRKWAVDGLSFSIRPRNLGNFAAGDRQVVGAVKNAIIDGALVRGLNLRVDAAQPDVVIAVSMHDEAVTVGIDLVGWAMHKRGYRLSGGIAPLRENLAAALLMLSRFDPRREFLIDPTCGSGTIAIEAALMARAEPLFRRATAADGLFDTTRVPTSALFADAVPRVLANDLAADAAERSRENCARAGVENDVVVTNGDLRDISLAQTRELLSEPERTPLILANLPYGVRLAPDRLLELYGDIDEWLGGFGGGRAGFLVANPEFELAMSRRYRSKKPLTNGSQRGYFYLYDL